MTAAPAQASPAPNNQPRGDALILGDHLDLTRVSYGLQVSSKKRLLEELAALLSRGEDHLDKSTIFQVLTERERLGSTGVGHGVALPHARLNGLAHPVVSVIRLKNALDFDALDGEAVTLIIGLLVPADADKTHLEILAKLATLLSDDAFRQRLMDAESAETLYQLLASG